MTERPIRWGVLGAANFALTDMAPAIHAARGADLAALATSSTEKAARFSAFAPGLRVHDSYEALLDDPAIDAVYIPLPNHMHVEWTEKALATGKAVLCEKPVALDVAGLDALIAARDAAGVLAAEAYMIVHHPQWLRVRALLAEGAVGELRHVNALFSFNNPDPGNIRNRPDTGGGALYDIGVYPCGAVRFATGQEPQEVSARLIRENGVDVTADVSAAFDGFSFFAKLSMRLCPWQEVVFHGTEGVLRLTAPFNAGKFGEARIEHRDGAGRVTVETFPTARQYVLQVEAFGDSLRDGTPYACPLEFSRGTLDMIGRAYAAAG
ncbi:putative dehydrogenase [Rhodovulum iodosum]|uniref:Dehydrogenase n=1 Tax=Rhodovulum iodosum TaxID=68291 RepID=A0ABV3XP43_9RHOB|nr:Gfo/Idh/MocA family oxidoreductase [Rhodovulum robiginosum]RSK31597.1 gfo/Idh/MocA family oxidoreductase [Rhodovulum robiginosum]